MTQRAAIYARSSSDSQREALIDDQIRLCKERLAAEGWSLVQVFRDAAFSGANTLRPGYQALLEGAREAAFDVVISEALDRLSRDQEDVAALFKRLRFAGIRIVTLAEGEITELHVGLKRTMNALFLRDLADKTRRGIRGRVEAGRSAGGRAFGLCGAAGVGWAWRAGARQTGHQRRKGRGCATHLRQLRGRRQPLAIDKMLNAECIPGPDGRAWRDTTIRGQADRGTGLLNNTLYIGRLSWNRCSYIARGCRAPPAGGAARDRERRLE
jgi:DNA invertase Pin-like site-specific DNA recombinase